MRSTALHAASRHCRSPWQSEKQIFAAKSCFVNLQIKFRMLQKFVKDIQQFWLLWLHQTVLTLDCISCARPNPRSWKTFGMRLSSTDESTWRQSWHPKKSKHENIWKSRWKHQSNPMRSKCNHSKCCLLQKIQVDLFFLCRNRSCGGLDQFKPNCATWTQKNHPVRSFFHFNFIWIYLVLRFTPLFWVPFLGLSPGQTLGSTLWRHSAGSETKSV